MYKHFRNLILAGVALVTVALLPAHAASQVQRTDTLSRQPVLTQQGSEVHPRMMTSPLPVSIRQQGRQLCVQSRYNQLLPVYTENGTFYTAVRLSKGTNWISGLPKGSYLINNRKFTIY